MFSLEIISLVLVAIINTMIAWIIASQSWQVAVNRYFVLAASFVVLWSVGTLALIAGDTSLVVHAGTVLFLVAPMYLIFFLSLFAAVFPARRGRSLTPINILFAVVTIVASLAIISSPDSLIVEVASHGNGNVVTVDPLWYGIYSVFFTFAFSVTFSEFILRMKHFRGYQRKQMAYVLAGTFAAAALSTVTNLLLPVFGQSSLIWLGPTWTLFYVVTVSISIVKHQLFDIRLAAVRSVAYLGVLLTLSIVYYVIAYVLSVFILGVQATDTISISPLNIFLALILAFLFQPIKHFFDRVTNDIFYRDSYNSEEFFARLSILLSSTVELRGLLERAAEQIASTFKAEQAFFFLYYENETLHHMSAGTRRHSRLPVYDARLLDEYAGNGQDKVFLTDLLDNTTVRRMLVSHGISLVMPLRNGEKIMGYVLLGDHRSRSYTKRDLNVLTTISNELVIAIQNALSLHEVKELNATLQQRIDVATRQLRASNAQLKHLDEVKDEFMSMASHQLRTPLTSVKGYLSMVLDGDVGKISPQQEKLLTEAFNSSERMVRLIADFLNVSRLQTGKFMIDKSDIELRQIVEQEVRNLTLMAAGRKLTLRLESTDQDIPLRADGAKLREVIMNFIDNAIYYSTADSTIAVKLEKHADYVEFTVHDTGIGVPKEEQSRLFNKFYRATNARKQRPDGTGVGLYLARKVVTAHGGSVIFHSVPGKGSTFGFRIPTKPTRLSR